jgi:hypothetical protein
MNTIPLSKEQVYENVTRRMLSDPNGTRMDIVYAAMEEYAAQQLQPPGTSDAVEVLKKSVNELKNSRTVLKTLCDFPCGTDESVLKRLNEKAASLDDLISSIESFLQTPGTSERYSLSEKDVYNIISRSMVAVLLKEEWKTPAEFLPEILQMLNRTPKAPVSDTTGSEDRYVADNQNNQETERNNKT